MFRIVSQNLRTLFPVQQISKFRNFSVKFLPKTIKTEGAKSGGKTKRKTMFHWSSRHVCATVHKNISEMLHATHARN